MAKITKTKGGLFTTKVYVGNDLQGKPVQKRVTAPTKTELNKLIVKAKAEYTSYAESRTSLTLRMAYQKYMDAKKNVLGKRTLDTYDSYFRFSFQNLMSLPIDSITREDIQKEVNEMVLTQKEKTIRNKVALLTSVMNEYAQKGSIKVTLPKRTKPKLHIPTKVEVETLLDAVKDTPMEIPILLAAYCGMRRGEVFALTYEDINYEESTLSVYKALGKKMKRGYEVKAPKTYAGYRKIDIPQRVMDRIIAKKEENLPLIEITPSVFDDRYRYLFTKLGIPSFRYHDLRHFYASILVSLNIPDIYIMKMIGHSTTSFLKATYEHTLDDVYSKYREIIKQTL